MNKAREETFLPMEGLILLKYWNLVHGGLCAKWNENKILPEIIIFISSAENAKNSQ